MSPSSPYPKPLKLLVTGGNRGIGKVIVWHCAGKRRNGWISRSVMGKKRVSGRHFTGHTGNMKQLIYSSLWSEHLEFYFSFALEKDVLSDFH